MTRASARQQPADAPGISSAPAAPKRQKLAALLVTADVELWPQIGAHLPTKLSFRQIDSVGELLRDVASDTPAVVVWDARGCEEKTADLSRIQSHSARFAMIVLDDDDSAWESAIQNGQIVAFCPVPVDQSRLIGALGGAYEEARARVALLGEQSGAHAPAGGGKRIARMAIAGGFAVVVAAGAALMLSRQSGHDGNPANAPSAIGAADPGARGGIGIDGSRPLAVRVARRGEGRCAHRPGAARHARSTLHRARGRQCSIALSQRVGARPLERGSAAGAATFGGSSSCTRAIGAG
jgi:hypothetical protein